ncbi:MAG: YgeY family selenium metabolism-linked hydrolase [Candidatus Hodarchaeota archaeon]
MMNQKIRELVETHKEDIMEFTRELVSIPSYEGNEEPIIMRLEREMEHIGFDDIQIDNMGNLMGQIGSGKNILAIDGHVDTVDIGNPENWPFDPFKGKYENDIIYGRGACDQKGGLASVFYATRILKKIGLPEDMTLLITATVQEEHYEGLNWQYIIRENKITPDTVLLTEPSSLNIAIGHRGRVDLKIHTTGISSHGAAPERGENAIYKIAPIVLDIEKICKKLPIDPIFGKGSITVTDIRSTSPSINAVADSATIHVDRRLNSNDTLETVLNELKSLPSVKNAEAHIFVPEYKHKSDSRSVYSFNAYYPTWFMEESHPLVQTAIKAYKNQLNENPKLSYWRFSTNGAATKGIFDIPTIGFGPGFEKYAHTVDDQVPVDHLIKATEFYTSFVKFWGNS